MKKKASLSYLAAPYRHDDPRILRFRLAAVTYTAYEMINQGRMVFSPLTHNLPIDRIGFHGDWSKWGPYDKLLLSRCDKLLVLTLPGWEESSGVTSEIRWAEELGIPMEKIEASPEALKVANEESLKSCDNLRDALLRNVREHPDRYPTTQGEAKVALKKTLRNLENLLELSNEGSSPELRMMSGEALLRLYHLADEPKFDLLNEGANFLISAEKDASTVSR